HRAVLHALGPQHPGAGDHARRLGKGDGDGRGCAARAEPAGALQGRRGGRGAAGVAQAAAAAAGGSGRSEGRRAAQGGARYAADLGGVQAVLAAGADQGGYGASVEVTAYFHRGGAEGAESCLASFTLWVW